MRRRVRHTPARSAALQISRGRFCGARPDLRLCRSAEDDFVVLAGDCAASTIAG